MTRHELLVSSETLEEHILRASQSSRIALQPQLQMILSRLEQDGVAVPARLRNLNSALIDEAIEARFDNMPI